MSADAPVRMRLEKWRILTPTCLLVPFFGYFLYEAVRRDTDILGFGLAAMWLFGWLGFLVNYLWLDFLEVNDRTVRRVQFLGLIRKEVPIRLLTRVKKGSMAPLWFSYDSLRFCSAGNTIEVNYEIYGKMEVTRGLRKLSDAGVEVDASLVKDLRLD